MNANPKLEEKLLSQEATRRISSQLEEVEQIQIEVQTDLLKIFQGQVDAVSLTGQGLVMQQQIRVQEINLQTDSIAVNLVSAIFGQIKLNTPVNVVANIVLTETDINHALSSKLIRNLVKDWVLDVQGELINLELQQMQISLPNHSQIECQGKILVKEQDGNQLLDYTAIIYPPPNSQSTLLKNFSCIEGTGISVELILALIQKLKEIVNLSYFEWEEMKFNLKNLTVQKGKLLLVVEAEVKQIPALVAKISEQ
ncbi:MAG TPA: DUF2993 domain-containing protein [Nostocaceae cyanobacterium]|nr:DUF2993 domain-containing protein [Nostocaceae cyanobacterium]